MEFELFVERWGMVAYIIVERSACDIEFADFFGGLGNAAKHIALRIIALIGLIEAFERFLEIVHAIGIDIGKASPEFALDLPIFFFDDVESDLFG